jgi:hypothetical protein
MRIKDDEIRMNESDMWESEVAAFMGKCAFTINTNAHRCKGYAEHAFKAPTMSGWLFKRGDNVAKSWKRHWFVLTDGYVGFPRAISLFKRCFSCLYYFLNPKDKSPRCIIPLDNTQVGRGHLDFYLRAVNGVKCALPRVCLLDTFGTQAMLLKAANCWRTDAWNRADTQSFFYELSVQTRYF